MRRLIISNTIIINNCCNETQKKVESKKDHPLIVKAKEKYPSGTMFISTDPNSKKIFTSTGDFYMYYGSVVAHEYFCWSAPVYCGIDNEWAEVITEDKLYVINLLDKIAKEKKPSTPIIGLIKHFFNKS